MEKSIQSLLKRLSASESMLKSSFISIKGGASLVDQEVGTNSTVCDNQGTCSGTNSATCTNYNCPDATNSSPTKCTNSHTCFG